MSMIFWAAEEGSIMIRDLRCGMIMTAFNRILKAYVRIMDLNFVSMLQIGQYILEICMRFQVGKQRVNRTSK